MSPEWVSLNRMLTRGVARAGITFPAGLPQSIVVIASVEGSKCAVPRSAVLLPAATRLDHRRERVLRPVRIGAVALHPLDRDVAGQ